MIGKYETGVFSTILTRPLTAERRDPVRRDFVAMSFFLVAAVA